MISWKDLRTLNGDQKEAFEELCTQLARQERDGFPPKTTFVRKGRPDAGVECFFRTPSGEETCWQAKFFTTSPTSSQWGQCDSSVKQALDKHPRLVEYILCFAVDLPDARKPEEKSARDKWDEHVEKWKRWATEKLGRDVMFTLWDSSALISRLSKDANRGRTWFWFESELLSPAWFRRRLDESIDNLDQRYRPKLHFDVQVERALAAFIRAEAAQKSHASQTDQLELVWQYLWHHALEDTAPTTYPHLVEAVTALRHVMRTTSITDDEGVASKLADAVNLSLSTLTQVNEEVRDALRKKADREQRDRQRTAWRTIQQLSEALGEVQGYLRHVLSFADRNLLVLHGKGGIGKSQVVARLAEQHLEDNGPVVLLLGEHFTPGNPWNQITSELDLPGVDRDGLLGGLESAAEAAQKPALLIIDALNEHGPAIHDMWKSRLLGMRGVWEKYPLVKVILTVRTPIEEDVLPPPLQSGGHLLLHRGFMGHEVAALTHLHASFNLPPPGIPPVAGEFSNPLFQLLRCEALRAELDAGRDAKLFGFVETLDAWFRGAFRRVEDALGLDPDDEEVLQSIHMLVDQMVADELRLLPAKRAKQALKRVRPYTDYKKSLYKALLKENVLVETKDGSGKKAVRFQFDRMYDTLVARAIIRAHLSTSNEIDELEHSPQVNAVWDDPWTHNGVLEALAVVLPLDHDLELTQISCGRSASAEHLILTTLSSRDPATISESIIGLVRRSLANEDTRWHATEQLLLLAGLPDHPLNARLLHDHLGGMGMNERDASWSFDLSLHHDDTDSPTQRLLDWTRAMDRFDFMDDRSRVLTAVALAWTFSTSHRPLRDQATKAVVRVLDGRPDLALAWLRFFDESDDDYVIERVLACAYGILTRIREQHAAKPITAHLVATWVNTGRLPAHILIRDYLRGIAELAGEGAPLFPRREWDPSLPTLGELHQHFGNSEIVDSMTDGGDFDRYCLGSNSWRFPWRPQRLGETPPTSSDEVRDQFLSSLSHEAVEIWDEYMAARRSAQLARSLARSASWTGPLRPIPTWNPAKQAPVWDSVDETGVPERAGDQFLEALLSEDPNAQPANDGEEANEATATGLSVAPRHANTGAHNSEMPSSSSLDDEANNAEVRVQELSDALQAALSDEQGHTFIETMESVLDGSYDRKSKTFPLNITHRWLLQEVLNLGWTAATLGVLDRRHHRPYEGRSANKPERLGKKYQWIALHRLLAVAADNFVYHEGLYDDDNSDDVPEYRGPWQIARRDLDPTCLLPKTKRQRFRHKPTWWSPAVYDLGRATEDDESWVYRPASLPKPGKLIEVQQPGHDEHWLTLDCHREWRESLPPVSPRTPFEQRTLYYWLRAYLVRREHLDGLLLWANEQNFMGRWMPETGEQTPSLMLRERGWSTPWRHFNCYYRGYPGWDTGREERGQPHPVHPSWDYYMAENGTHDCSIDETYTMNLPHPLLVETLGLRHGHMDGHFIDSDGKLAAFDPSVREEGPSALLLRRDMLDRLRANGLELMWTMFGEQRVGVTVNGTQGKIVGAADLSAAFVLRTNGWEGRLNGFAPSIRFPVRWALHHAPGHEPEPVHLAFGPMPT